ncbi:MAG: LolA family protein [Candidatus Brocadiales bacterium]
MRRLTYPGYTICPQEQLFNRDKKVEWLRGEEVKRLGCICLFAFLPFLIGCAGVRPVPPVAIGPSWMLQRPSGMVQNLSLEQIKDTLGSENTKFTTLKAKARITIDAPAINGPLFCNGYIRLQRPKKLRVIGTKLTSTVFDMLTDGERFWLYLPSEKKVYTGRCNSMRRLVKPDITILPDDIAMLLDYNDALTTGTILTNDVKRILILETWPGLWLIHLVDLSNETAALRANLYIDRVGVNVIRYDIFDINGNIRVQALFDDYTRFDDAAKKTAQDFVPAIPQRIAIFWPDEDTKLTLSLTNIATNEQINPKVFQFSKPKKAEIVFLDEM